MKIGDREIGPGHPVLIVAECGINHDGSMEKALAMVREAKRSGADAFKVQAFAADCFTSDRAEWKGESQAAMFRRYEMTKGQIVAIADECRKEGLIFFGTPDCMEHAGWLWDAGTQAIKVGSDDLTNLPLIRDLSGFGLPMILSSGMATIEEVGEAVLAAANVRTAILYCCSVYPAQLEHLRFGMMKSLRDLRPWVGFSDHTMGYSAAVAAVALGACIVEKHFALSGYIGGPDREWSADQVAFSAMTKAIRGIEAAMSESPMHPDEVAMRVTARRSVVAAADLGAGKILYPGDLELRRPGDGLPPKEMGRLFGKWLGVPKMKGETIRTGDVW